MSLLSKKNKRRKKKEFSKVLLIQESALIWINTLAYIVLAFYCVRLGYIGSLPWLTAGASLPWAAYGVSQACYYHKATKENTKNGIKYETVLSQQNTNTEGDTVIVDDNFGPI